MAKQSEVYSQVVTVTAELLGPAASRFIDRHIQNHLHKEPTDLTHKDLPTLIDWIRISIAFLTEDRQVIDNLIYKLTLIADKQASRK